MYNIYNVLLGGPLGGLYLCFAPFDIRDWCAPLLMNLLRNPGVLRTGSRDDDTNAGGGLPFVCDHSRGKAYAVPALPQVPWRLPYGNGDTTL